ncbi:hypothetical protein GCM10011392_27700 [Wenxinia marina]|nr:hypothetical protein GCM10011392_27700 [Wenxinia marina]
MPWSRPFTSGNQVPVWCITRIAVRKAVSTGRRNTFVKGGCDDDKQTKIRTINGAKAALSWAARSGAAV